MSKKQGSKKAGKTEIELTPAESHELESILDRLSVQNPEGESFRNLLKSLRGSLMERENLVTALGEEIARNPTEAGFRAFVELKDLVRSKIHRRMIKQTAYRLAQRGFVAPAEKDEPSERVVVLRKEVRPAVAHFVPADDNLWFVSAFIPESRFYADALALAVFPENQMERVHVSEVEGSYRKYKELLQIVTEKHAKPCEIPLGHAALLASEMVKLCRDETVSSEVSRALRMLEPNRDPDGKPYVYELMSGEAEAEGDLSEAEVRELLKVVNISPLYLQRNDLVPYREEIQGVENSLLSVPREIQDQRIHDIVLKAAANLCVDKTRFLYQRFFQEQAMWLKLSSRSEAAVLAWRTARHLENCAHPGENQMTFYLVVLSLSRYWPEDFAEPAEKSVKPYEESDSGLILPRF